MKMLEAMTFVTASILAIIAGLLRCVFGWAENALRDGKVEAFEWRQLAGTIAVYLGTVNVMSIGLDPKMATAAMVVLDMIRTALKAIAPKEE
jgi:hypothetical protein